MDSSGARRAIVVLCMDRTGSSLCTNILRLLGAELGEDLLGPGPNNEHGFWESREILRINEGILATLGFTWQNNSTLLSPFPSDWWHSDGLSNLRAVAIQHVH